LQVDDGAQRACVFNGLPTQTILTAIVEPKRLFPPRCKLWPFRRGLDEYADEAGHLRLTTRGALSRHHCRECAHGTDA
jgi:hypothetical protein